MTPVHKFILGLSLVVKFVLALIIPLVLDEYYYWIWGQNLQWSYFDHPPMVGWLMAMGDHLRFLGDGAVRWPFVLLGQGTLVLWYQLAKPWLSSKELTLYLLVLLLNPLAGWGGLVAVPDVPVLFFWTLSLCALVKIIRAPNLGSYLLLGVSLGLGFLSKYHIVLFVPCVLFFAFWSRNLKKLFNQKTLFTVIAGLVACTPVLIWNLQNDWASFAFQWKHGTGSFNFQYKTFLEYGVGQFLLLFPVFFILALKRLHNQTLMACFGFGPLLFFLITSLFARVEANWPLVAYPGIYLMAMTQLSVRSKKWVQGTLVLWGGLLMGVFGVVIFGNGGYKLLSQNKLFESQEFEKLLPFIDNKSTYFANSYQMASYLTFKSGQMVCTLPSDTRINFFSFSPDCPKVDKEFYFILKTIHQPSCMSTSPVSCEPLEEQFVGNQFKIVKMKAL